MAYDNEDTVRFDPAVVDRIVGHLNRCHRGETLMLVRAATAGPAGTGDPIDAVSADIAGLDGEGMDILAECADGPSVVRLEYRWPATTIAEVGEEVRRLYREACRSGGTTRSVRSPGPGECR